MSTSPTSSASIHANITEHTAHGTASLAVICPRTEQLLLIRHLLTGRNQFPGGHIDPGEDAGTAALREVWEETGVPAQLALQRHFDLPGTTQKATPWAVHQHRAPADPHRGYPSHLHIDHLLVGVADSRQTPHPQKNEVSSAFCTPIADLADLPQVRADIPVAAAQALRELKAWLTMRPETFGAAVVNVNAVRLTDEGLPAHR